MHAATHNPWFHAAIVNDFEFIKAHVKECAKQVDALGRTALITAAINGSWQIVEFMIPYEAGSQSLLCEAAIFCAVEQRNLAMLQQLAKKEMKLLNQNNQSALTMCVDADWPEGARVLQDDVALDEFTGFTGLIRAVHQQKMELVRILGPAQADYTDSRGRFALQHALDVGNVMLISILVQCMQNRQNFLIDYMQSVKNLALIEHLQHQFGARNEFGRTALMVLCRRTDLPRFSQKEIDVVNRLITKEIKQQDRQGLSALMHAAHCGNTQMVELLVRKEMLMQDALGYTALMHAVIGRQYAAARALVFFEKNKQNKQGSTALKLAVSQRDIEMIKIIKEHEADDADNSAVELCIKQNHVAALKELNEKFVKLPAVRKTLSFELSQNRETLQLLKSAVRDDREVLQSVKSRHDTWKME